MKSSSLFILLFFITVTLSAQEKNNYHTTSFCFGINGFVLNNYYGGVGGRHWISESTVINASVGFSISQEESDKTDNIDKQLEKNKYFNF